MFLFLQKSHHVPSLEGHWGKPLSMSSEGIGPRPIGRTWKAVPRGLRRIHCGFQRTVSSSIWSSNLNIGDSPDLSKENYMELYIPGSMASQALQPHHTDLHDFLDPLFHHDLGYRWVTASRVLTSCVCDRDSVLEKQLFKMKLLG